MLRCWVHKHTAGQLEAMIGSEGKSGRINGRGNGGHGQRQISEENHDVPRLWTSETQGRIEDVALQCRVAVEKAAGEDPKVGLAVPWRHVLQ